MAGFFFSLTITIHAPNKLFALCNKQLNIFHRPKNIDGFSHIYFVTAGIWFNTDAGNGIYVTIFFSLESDRSLCALNSIFARIETKKQDPRIAATLWYFYNVNGTSIFVFMNVQTFQKQIRKCLLTKYDCSWPIFVDSKKKKEKKNHSTSETIKIN